MLIIPSSLLKHAPRLIRHLLIHPTLLLRVDLALAELLLCGVEACRVVGRGSLAEVRFDDKDDRGDDDKIESARDARTDGWTDGRRERGGERRWRWCGVGVLEGIWGIYGEQGSTSVRERKNERTLVEIVFLPAGGVAALLLALCCVHVCCWWRVMVVGILMWIWKDESSVE